MLHASFPPPTLSTCRPYMHPPAAALSSTPLPLLAVGFSGQSSRPFTRMGPPCLPLHLSPPLAGGPQLCWMLTGLRSAGSLASLMPCSMCGLSGTLLHAYGGGGDGKLTNAPTHFKRISWPP
jgi:hypothetical protein